MALGELRMPVPVAVVIAIALVFTAIVVGRLALAWRKYSGKRVIECPDNQQPAGVVVDARHAALSAALGASELRLSACSRWPEKAGCGQPCLSQIAAAPADCLVRNILTRWYEGKTCASCGRVFGAVEWEAAKPALRLPDGVSVEWNQVPAEKLQETLAAALPLCFACHTASTLVRERPDLVVDRSATDGQA
jgi:hypothetical protein